jgi:hypothetical protein
VNVSEYEKSWEIPTPKEYPNTPWTHQVTNGEKYRLAFEIPADEQESADMYFAMLIGHRLRYDKGEIREDGHFVGHRPLQWREAFERERDALAWLAFAKDIGDFALYEVIDGQRVERTKHRDHVWNLFGARLPERIAGKPAEILETVHIKREKAAKGRGESYWRKGHAPKPEPSSQGALF